MKLRHALLPLSLLAALPSVAAARGLEVRDMVAMDRVSAPVLTADGGTVVFAKRSVDANLKASTALFARNLPPAMQRRRSRSPRPAGTSIPLRCRPMARPCISSVPGTAASSCTRSRSAAVLRAS